MFNAENFIIYACCLRRNLLLTDPMFAGAYNDTKKGQLLHVRVTVDHEVNSEREELPWLTLGALFHAKIWRGTMCARLT